MGKGAHKSRHASDQKGLHGEYPGQKKPHRGSSNNKVKRVHRDKFEDLKRKG